MRPSNPSPDRPPPDTRLARLAAAARRAHLRIATTNDRDLLAAAELTRLPSGHNNTTYACRIDEHRACMKLYRVDDHSRAQREWQILTALAALGYPHTPKPYRHDPDPATPVVIMELVPGEQLGDDPLTDRQLDALHTAYDRLFQITPSTLPDAALPTVQTDIARMHQRVEQAFTARRDTVSADPVARQALDCWNAWSASSDPQRLRAPAPIVCGRGDPNLRNCLWDDHTLRFIDLEYAGWTDRAYELADLLEHPESRRTPDPTWQRFLDRFDLPEAEWQRHHAARRLIALFWTTRLWASPDDADASRYAAQVQRTTALLQRAL